MVERKKGPGSPLPELYPVKLEGYRGPRDSDMLANAARRELLAFFETDFDVPNPPRAFFETLDSFHSRDIKDFDDIYCLPDLTLRQDDALWEREGIVRPPRSFLFNKGVDVGFSPVVFFPDEFA